ncbi:unnamed protein product [Bursaphelenchus okinawaensis]|uniref:Uncharacterized protein n=1 Tax=Bursaphelenchus okinawaensis TaxID=465554 RepID=A0A811K2E6_9BILA|nr:unnamed protein product [Bursaphelenchus okinawaensis]CAG9090504.1 unnamed protein product [Bursaphelenchus okinawaensis]
MKSTTSRSTPNTTTVLLNERANERSRNCTFCSDCWARVGGVDDKEEARRSCCEQLGTFGGERSQSAIRSSFTDTTWSAIRRTPFVLKG